MSSRNKAAHGIEVQQQQEEEDSRVVVTVDVIVPVYNSESTIVETVTSAFHQRFPTETERLCCRDLGGDKLYSFGLDLTICCYNDGSTDKSLELLHGLKKDLEDKTTPHAHDNTTQQHVKVTLLIGTSSTSHGAGYARNQATKLHNGEYIAMFDSDDIMLPTRIVEQVVYMKRLWPSVRHRTLLGCTFQRDPPDSTWHYAQWANSLSEERRMLERFREVTVIQPTWMITRDRFQRLGGYIEAKEDKIVQAGTLNSQNSTDDLNAASYTKHSWQKTCTSSLCALCFTEMKLYK